MIPHSSHLQFLARVVFLFIAIVTGVVLAAMILVWSSFEGSDTTFPVDCAVVFGAAVRKGSEPGPGITRRTETAAKLYREGKVQKLVLTGGKGSGMKASEAAVMRGVAMLSGVSPEDIVLEEESQSTWENLEFSYPLVEDCESVIAVSDRYHLARIESIARQQGWGTLATYPAESPPFLLFELKSAIREALGIVYYATKDYFVFFER